MQETMYMSFFKLDSNKITNLTGQYHITNQDGEYISSGKYTVY